ncbi:DUF805 domain-containing protein [Octadecabacter ascidiaceicola]|uniref:Inner membrane protein YhaI n=1 Tax=Octadecabacter ascidiaceicola TaxID=1655543 RepID=A0A238K8F7_9RHOB|nr:DUF805 domain-containing protein [Octadecabacter ascidiaceicola]SMX39191.1 hypothetical protein OCA8868_01879 [Octadecabacter ascidiaceicola]
MKPILAIRSAMSHAFDFTGRATRSEFWWFFLFIAILHSVLANYFAAPNPNGFSFHFGIYLSLDINEPWWSNVYAIVFVLPFASALVRRGHDINVHGSKFFIVPFIVFAAFVVIVKALPTQEIFNTFMFVSLLFLFVGFLIVTLKRSDPDTNRFGPNPNEVPS